MNARIRRGVKARGHSPNEQAALECVYMAMIAKRGEPHGIGLGIFRHVVERTIAWLHGFRCLRIRWDRRDDIHEAFLGPAVCVITHRHVQRIG